MTDRSTPTETIVALATAPGEAAIGVVRLSGPLAIAAAERIVRLASGRPLAALDDRRAAFGHAVDPADGVAIDEVLVTVMRA
ncbi:MAG: tRNA uridine-5-carboxymethylaminomethyl(34) synthesis GTPase MnmE, partial [Nitrospiria bacterium]